MRGNEPASYVLQENVRPPWWLSGLRSREDLLTAEDRAGLLDVSRLEAGALAVFPRRPSDPGGIVADSLDALGPLARTVLADIPFGLGLVVSRGLAEAMGGTVEPQETRGGGLTMVVSLPAAPARPAAQLRNTSQIQAA